MKYADIMLMLLPIRPA